MSGITSKKIAVYKAPTHNRNYHSKSAAYMRWAGDIIQKAKCSECDREHPCEFCFKERYEPAYEKLRKRLARWLRWRDSKK